MKILRLALATLLLAVPAVPAPADPPARITDPAALLDLAGELRAAAERGHTPLYRRMIAATEGPQGMLNRNPELRLMGIDRSGMPRFYLTDNLNAARSTNTDDVWPGGSAGFGLTGAGTALGELGEWDGGGVRTTHNEFGGRVTQMDAPGGLLSHSTHVAGTLVAAGLSSGARGMAYQSTLAAYDWNDDTAEMAIAAAAGMRVSNHSYGFAAGWLFNLDGSGEWFWLGDTTVSVVEDYGFGFYGPDGAAFDTIAWEAPEYLIVKSAGNDRNAASPTQPDSHYVWANDAEAWVWSMTVHDADGAPDGYDTVPWFGVAKNILTVGAVNDIPDGWTSPTSVVMSSFSAWGPTDDGRIKPDIVANGVSLTSTTSSSNGSYGTSSGTSMATPNAAGSIHLLVRHYLATHGVAPRSATSKAVVLHTANEAGLADGPDYRHGWGMLDAAAAAALIHADSSDVHRIREATLADGASDAYRIEHPGGDLRVTIVWTDPPGVPVAPALDPADPMLVHDLDLRLEALATSTVHMPWVLDPQNPVNVATTGDNVLDNVEQVYVAAAPAGTYQVSVGHKGALAGGSQDYSIVGSAALADPPTAGIEPGTPSLRFRGLRPNPFTHETAIAFELPARMGVDLAIYDLGGRRVRTLDRSVRDAGTHTVRWDGRGDRGEAAAPGIYFLRASAGGETQVRRLVRLE